MELTYEELKDILEMSGVLNEKDSFRVIEWMKDKKMKASIGGAIVVGNLLCILPGAATHHDYKTARAIVIDALIKAYSQYTSGKLENKIGRCPNCGCEDCQELMEK